jgi:hypothetical protein
MMHLVTFLTLIITTAALPLQNTDLTPKPAANPTIQAPPWLHAVTFPLICYDVVIIAVLCWMWASGQLAWLSRPVEQWRGRQSAVRAAGGRRGTREMEREMRRVGMI